MIRFLATLVLSLMDVITMVVNDVNNMTVKKRITVNMPL